MEQNPTTSAQCNTKNKTQIMQKCIKCENTFEVEVNWICGPEEENIETAKSKEDK